MGEMDGPAVIACTRCPALVESRRRIVNGVGPVDANLVFVGEAPGRQEDEQGEPFVGRSGEILDAALRDRGLARCDVRITNCVRCRPPANRDPHADELANCREYLVHELATIDPDLIVTLGKVPSEHLLGRQVAVTNEAGNVHDVAIDSTTHRVLICLHPAATLYDRSQRDTFERALERAVSIADVAGDGGTGQSRIGDF